jgi:hypothetical protein
MVKIESSVLRRVVQRNPVASEELIAALFWIEEDAKQATSGSKRISQLLNDNETI